MDTQRNTAPTAPSNDRNRAAHRPDMQTATAPTPAEAVGDRLLDVGELAGILGVQPVTLHDWRYRGRTDRMPPAVKLGSSLRWRASDVRFFLENLRAS